MQGKPLISVLLPIFNAERFLAEAIQSVLNQTYPNFELIILNDGSTDGSDEIVKSFDDKRIKYFTHENIGLAATLNKGLSLACGEYIARQDNDDVSLPERFEHQMDYLLSHIDVDLLGTAAEIIDERGQSTQRSHHHPTDNISLKWALLFNNPFVHSSVIFKKSKAMACGGYNTNTSYFEDYHLWSAMAQQGKIANLPNILLKYREVNSGMSKSTNDYLQRVKNQSEINILHYLKDVSEINVKSFVAMQNGDLSVLNQKPAKSMYQKVFQELIHAFCSVEKISPDVIQESIKTQNISFKRQYYNAQLQQVGLSFFTKLKVKILRKLLFTLNKKYL